MTASGSSGANRYSTIEPTTRASRPPSACLTTSVYRPSWAAMTSAIRRSEAGTRRRRCPIPVPVPAPAGGRCTWPGARGGRPPPLRERCSSAPAHGRRSAGTPRVAGAAAMRGRATAWATSGLGVNDDLHRLLVPSSGGERVLRLLQTVGAGDQSVEVDPAGGHQCDRRGPGSGVPEGAGQLQLPLLHDRQRQRKLVGAHADEDGPPGPVQ